MLSLGVDLVAVSFVQTAGDLLQARQLLIDAGAPNVPLIAKLERPRAIENLDAILAVSDAVMVARGDLGLEMPLERVPRVQKEITVRARRRGIPVFVATQVLESMTSATRPTRAEVSDAANAVADGVDGIMLAGETAVGAHPALAVQTLDAIIREAEAMAPREAPPAPGAAAEGDHAQALCDAAVTLAERAHAAAIVAVTRGGWTARSLSALRPRAAIIAATEREDTARRLVMHWGVRPVCGELAADVATAGAVVGRELVARGLVAPGGALVLVSIDRDLARLDANYVKLQRL